MKEERSAPRRRTLGTSGRQFAHAEHNGKKFESLSEKSDPLDTRDMLNQNNRRDQCPPDQGKHNTTRPAAATPIRWLSEDSCTEEAYPTRRQHSHPPPAKEPSWDDDLLTWAPNHGRKPLEQSTALTRPTNTNNQKTTPSATTTKNQTHHSWGADQQTWAPYQGRKPLEQSTALTRPTNTNNQKTTPSATTTKNQTHHSWGADQQTWAPYQGRKPLEQSTAPTRPANTKKTQRTTPIAITNKTQKHDYLGASSEKHIPKHTRASGGVKPPDETSSSQHTPTTPDTPSGKHTNHTNRDDQNNTNPGASSAPKHTKTHMGIRRGKNLQ